ncbi:Hypothetical_protein [Hexamita inflata]|uniref:Hypothetical_protein n=1 Tax=Hexamita inflata TaxID=28002 RepID=A0AA86QSL1_9EUKA|nr:Hypothetical protein HINF_LOCUS49947 [Hexamita inflata]
MLSNISNNSRVVPPKRKLETIPEIDVELSDDSVLATINDSRSQVLNRSNMSFITTTRLHEFVCIDKRELYEIQCNLEYLDVCQSKLGSQIRAMNRIAVKQIRQLQRQE